MSKSRKTLLATVMLTALGGAPALWAAGATSGGSEESMGMMMGKGGMSSGHMGNMMPMMKMMGEMNEMMKNCNKMMQTMMDEHQRERAPEKG